MFNKPFVVFNRIGTDGTGNMNSRIDTLLHTFGLEDHRITNITDNQKLVMDFEATKVQEILDKKRLEATDFVDRAFG